MQRMQGHALEMGRVMGRATLVFVSGQVYLVTQWPSQLLRKGGTAMEKAIIVLMDLNQTTMRGGQYTHEALKDLNEHLKQGWRVKQSSAMGGTGHTALSSSLVILEKNS